ncbi:MAG: tryptophan 2,3-dioxygenase family protein [Thermoanaerobaculales bacterium]|jgi:tryptophan 2,3-dioxygenase|nr:tryptophan 2,3-dioxygenase family protein [Thermoanaerobaculales bacterium]
MTIGYSSYLRLDELLSLQAPRSDGHEHDELLFITIHQVYELWLKQILHELKLLQLAMENSHTPIVSSTLKRVLTILKTLVAQIDILETMTPMSFGSFRELLEQASGFESVQFREVEFVLGRRRREVVEAMSPGSRSRLRLERVLGRPSIYDSFLRYLALLGYPIPQEVLARDFGEQPTPSPAVQESLIEIYRHDPGTWQICELMVDLDEGLQEWRYRHAVMMERTIGSRKATSPAVVGTPGRSVLPRSLFPDLWAIRSEL